MTLINDEALGRLVFRRSSYHVPALSDCSVCPTYFETNNIAVMTDFLYYTKFHENRAIGSEVTAGSVYSRFSIQIGMWVLYTSFPV